MGLNSDSYNLVFLFKQCLCVEDIMRKSRDKHLDSFCLGLERIMIYYTCNHRNSNSELFR